VKRRGRESKRQQKKKPQRKNPKKRGSRYQMSSIILHVSVKEKWKWNETKGGWGIKKVENRIWEVARMGEGREETRRGRGRCKRGDIRGARSRNIYCCLTLLQTR